MFSFLKKFVSKHRTKRKMEKKGFVGSRKRRKAENSLVLFFDRSRIMGLCILLLIWAVCVTVLLIPNYQAPYFKPIAGQEAHETIVTDFDFNVLDEDATEKKIAEEIDKLPIYFKIDPAKRKRNLNSLKTFIEESDRKILCENNSEEYSVNKNLKMSEFINGLDNLTFKFLRYVLDKPGQRKKLIFELKESIKKGVLNSEDKSKYNLFEKVQIIDSKNRKGKIKDLKELKTVKEISEETAGKMARDYSPSNRDAFKNALSYVFTNILQPNLVKDLKEKELAESSISKKFSKHPVLFEFEKGDTIVKKGDTLTKREIKAISVYRDKISEANKMNNIRRKLFKNALICLLIMVITGIYLHHIHPDILKSNHRMFLMGTVTIVSVLFNFLSIYIFNMLSPIFGFQYFLQYTIIPLGLASILISVMLGMRVAVYVGLFVSLIAALQMDNSFSLIITGMICSVIGGFAVRFSRNYRAFFFRAFTAVSASIFLTSLINFGEKLARFNDVFDVLKSSIINGAISATAALLLIFIFESIFQISTTMSLLLYSDLNHPLLKRLQLEAPGTYHHSLMVSTLAEQAAEAIAADPIKARVCALFHDIGKLEKPEYFTENNLAGESNKHEEKDLRSKMSSMIIKNHVKEGVDLAVKHKLKHVIKQAIASHHGTDLIKFFYDKARKKGEIAEEKGSLHNHDFSYPGPLPREKEVVLVSLADICEAASRSIVKPTHSKIEALVRELFRRKIRDAQLDEADLTFKELSLVRENFVKTLTTMLHGRVAYPEEENQNEDELFLEEEKISRPTSKRIKRPVSKGV